MFIVIVYSNIFIVVYLNNRSYVIMLLYSFQHFVDGLLHALAGEQQHAEVVLRLRLRAGGICMYVYIYIYICIYIYVYMYTHTKQHTLTWLKLP